jgi:outer membrane immunogenic protein
MPKAIRLGLAIAALMGAAAGYEVRAADLPVAPVYKAPIVAPAASYNWTGFYLGGNAGGSWGRSNTDVVFDPLFRLSVASTGSASQAMRGALGGLQAGYNLQTSALVFGLETDIQITSQKGDALLADTVTTPQDCLAPCTPPPPLVTTGTLDHAQKLPWFGTLRGRVGVTPADRWLVYGTGGLAFGEIRTDATFTMPAGGGLCFAPCTPAPAGSAAGSFSQTKAGWVVGGGVEAALGGGWTGKLEYLHMDLGSVSNTFASTVFPFNGTFTVSSRVTDDIVRAGVNYRFGGAVAKY